MKGKDLEIKYKTLLSKYGIVISQHHINEKFDTPQSLIKFRSEKYGDTIIDFFKPKKNV